MSYNKLGFTSGQKLKAEHLNHMEEGIANAANCEFEYYTGEVQLVGNSNFVFTELTPEDLFNNYCEMEVAVKLNVDSRNNPTFKYTFMNSAYGLDLPCMSIEQRYAYYHPTATLKEYQGSVILELTVSGSTGSVGIQFPAIIYVRLHRKV